MSPTDYTQRRPTAKLEMAHVLFTDIVGYSKLPMDHQEAVLHTLQEIVSATAEFLQAQATQEMIRLPTGDGMALVFFGDAEAAARCALEVSRGLKSHPEIPLRMGLHSGPVYRIADINANQNVAGGGINIAQRVMDCGDAGHILASRSVADVLGQLSNWKDCLHDLGEAEVKHGVRIHLYNLYTHDAGNAGQPQKLHMAQKTESTVRSMAKRKRLALGLVVAGAIAALAVGGFSYSHRAHGLTDKDRIVLSDFDNKTGDSVFDDTLRQGLSVQLEQSPFLDLVSGDDVNATLKEMGRPAGDRLTPEVTREVCQRTRSKAMLTGSIASLGSQFVIGLQAVNCNTGDVLVESQEQAAGREEVLNALDKAAISLRGKLGESLSSVQKYSTPLVDATTPSLEALKAFSLGSKAMFAKGDAAALPFFVRATELDPNFATAYGFMANSYANLNEGGRAAESARRAYELRAKASEWERFQIEYQYYVYATGELEKAAQTLDQWQQTYPSHVPYTDIGFVAASLGNWEKALEESQEQFRQDANQETINGIFYSDLAGAYVGLDRLDEAEAVVKQAEERKVEDEYLPQVRYWLAFLKGDPSQMARLLSDGMGKPGTEDLLLAAQADTEAWYGKSKSAHDLTRRAMDSAEHNDANETASGYQAEAALREVESGDYEQARADAEAALKRAPNRDVRAIAALVFARTGNVPETEKLEAELDKAFPLDTLVQRYWLPTIRAAVALRRKDPNRAIELLKATSTIELGQPTTLAICLCPVYLRGEAYLMLHDGNAAAAEFQKFIDHRGLIVNFSWGALARLGLARAYAAQGDTGKARAYQDFLTLWKDADPDIPILKQAKAEYAKLN
jgi:eukaryotic-like serine/threonine-protein kinase